MASASGSNPPPPNYPIDDNPNDEISDKELDNIEGNTDNDENNSEENTIQHNAAAERKGKGRRKIEMRKIENETNLQVTFSKRRAGIFKKASELGTLCGAESGIVIFSPGNKAHSFGNPNVNDIVDRFISNTPPPPINPADPTEQLLRACSDEVDRQRNQEIVELERLVQEEKSRKKEYKRKRSSGEGPPPMNELNYEQLAQMRRSVEAFQDVIATIVQQHTAGVVNPLNVHVPNRGGSGGLPLMAPSNMQSRPSHHFGHYGNEGAMFPSQAPPPLALEAGSSSSRPPPLYLGASSSYRPPPPLPTHEESYSTWPPSLSTSTTWMSLPPMPSLSLGGSSAPTPFNTGVGSSNAANPPNFGVGGSNMPTFDDYAHFSSMFGNFGYTMNDPSMALPSGPDQSSFPYNYGNPSQDLVPYGGETRSSDSEDEGSPRATQGNGSQNKSQGFNNNYGRGNY